MSVDANAEFLEFRNVDKIKFIGTSSNTIIDTTTGRLGIGTDTPAYAIDVRGTANVTALSGITDFNFQPTSNTASIEYDSNVVTEFNRSKKLIKYPRVAMTGSTSGGYTASASDESSGNSAWEAFDNDADSSSTDHRWRTNDNRYTDNSSSGTPSSPTGAASTYLFTGSEAGDWISIEFPERMKLVYFTITGIHYHTPYEGVIYGYNTTTSTWERVTSFINRAGNDGTNNPVYSPSFYVDEDTNYYSKYAMIVVKTNGHHATSMYEWKLYGILEYDPDAAGVDVNVTSYPNVPNTDWLEVYYDGQDYTTMPVTVDNKTGVSTYDATANGGVGFNSTYKAFTFDGTDDYITSTLTGLSSTQYTMAGWIKIDTLDSTVNTFFSLGDWASGNGRAVGIAIDSSNRIGANVKGIADATFSEVTVGKWYHVVADFTSDGDTHLYVNGNLVDTVAGTTFAIPTNPPLFIGSRANASGTVETARLFPGSIANFRLFNRAITSDEVWQLYSYQKEYFGHGDLSMTFKAGRLGIGTSEPRAVLDVRGDVAGPFTTFLTGDVTTSIVTSAPSTSTIYPVTSYTFDVPSEYHAYGTKSLEIYGQIKWCGEIDNPWNAMFSARLYYGGGLTSYVDSAENTTSNANTRNNGAGVPSTNTTNDDFISTLEACILSSRFHIPNCPVSNGSQLKLELRFRQGNASSDLYTNRTKTDLTNDVNYERGTTNFFLAVK